LKAFFRRAQRVCQFVMLSKRRSGVLQYVAL
jgi:hypothetical protein